jgi:hypothetical protein
MYWWICREVSGLNPSLGMLFEHVRTVLSSCKLDGQYHSVWYSMIMFFIVFPYSSMLFLSVFVALWHKASNSYSGACGKTSWWLIEGIGLCTRERWLGSTFFGHLVVTYIVGLQ